MLAAGAPSYGTPAAPPLVAKWASFQSSSRSSSGVMPMMAKTFRNVPFAMSRTACTGTATVRPSRWRITWWLPLTRTTSKPTRSSALTTCDPGDCRHPASHQATSSVSVSSGGRPYLSQERPQGCPEVGHCCLFGSTVAHRTDPRRQLGGRAPHPVLVLRDAVRHVDNPGHASFSHTKARLTGQSQNQPVSSPADGPFDRTHL